jgi:hypothetical protein
MTHLPDKPTNGEGRSDVSIPDHGDPPVSALHGADGERAWDQHGRLRAGWKAAATRDQRLSALAEMMDSGLARSVCDPADLRALIAEAASPSGVSDKVPGKP